MRTERASGVLYTRLFAVALAVTVPAAPLAAQGFELLEATIADAHSAMAGGRSAADEPAVGGRGVSIALRRTSPSGSRQPLITFRVA